MTPFECFTGFVALRLHFIGDYDYFKYNGKVNTEEPSFDLRTDRLEFVKLSKRVSDVSDLEALVVSNVTAGHAKAWVQHYLSPQATEQKTRWIEAVRNLGSIVNAETIGITKLPNLKKGDLLKPIEGGHPLLLTLFYSDQVSLETLIVYDSVFKFLDKWNTQILDDVMWPETATFMEKYKPFLKFDRDYMKRCITEGLKGKIHG